MIHDYVYRQVAIVMLPIVMIMMLLLVYQLIVTVIVQMIGVHGSHVSSSNGDYFINHYIIGCFEAECAISPNYSAPAAGSRPRADNVTLSWIAVNGYLPKLLISWSQAIPGKHLTKTM